MPPAECRSLKYKFDIKGSNGIMFNEIFWRRSMKVNISGGEWLHGHKQRVTKLRYVDLYNCRTIFRISSNICFISVVREILIYFQWKQSTDSDDIWITLYNAWRHSVLIYWHFPSPVTCDCIEINLNERQTDEHGISNERVRFGFAWSLH